MNLARYVVRAATHFGDRPMAYDGPRTLTYGRLEERSNRLANALTGLGVGFQDRVAIVLPNSFEWIEAEYGVAKIGAITLPLAPRLHEKEMARSIAAAEARLIIANREIADRIRPHLEGSGVRYVVVDPGKVGPDEIGYEDALAAGSSNPVCVDVDHAGHGRVLRFTSGSTGQPKGVLMSHRTWTAIAEGFLLDRRYNEQTDVVLNCGGFSHAGGLWILPTIMRGAAMQIQDKFDAELVVRHIEQGRATILQAAPTVFRRLLDIPDIRNRDLSRLKVATYGGAPIDSTTLADAIDVFGNVLLQSYGSNEASGVTILSPEEHLRFVGYSGWQQPLGRETILAEVKLVDGEGNPTPVGEIGEMAIRGPTLFHSYWRDPELTKKAFLDGGWFLSGDLAMRDETGLLYMSGRSKDIIITGGYNVSPREVERVLEDHPAVKETAVVGVPHREWGEQITAFVALRSGSNVSEDVLIDFCRDQMTSYKKPKRIYFVDALPLNSNGKVDKPRLRTMA